MTKKTTKRALLLSVLSMMLCVAMLVGSTFAWFTDSVTSGMNKIVAGNLDVELYHSNGKGENKPVDGNTELFVSAEDEKFRWEPGAMLYENFTVKNAGSLALKYKLMLKAECNSVDGRSLENVLKVAVLKEAFNGDRAEAMTADFDMTVAEFVESGALLASGELLEKDDAENCAVIVYWEPSENDNDYNFNNGKEEELYIELGVNLEATQAVSENDGFGDDYDSAANLPWSGKAATSEELAAAKNEEAKTLSITSPELFAAFSEDVKSGTTYDGYTVELKSSVDLNNLAWMPIGSAEHPFEGSFNGNDYSVEGLSSELFGYVHDATITKLSITVESITGGLIADASGTNEITNVTVNGTIVGNADSKNAAFILETKEGSDTTMTNCENNASVTSNIESAAGYVGSAYGKLTFTGCENNGAIVSTKSTGAKATGYIVTVRPGAEIAFNDCQNNGKISVKGAAELYGAGFICWNGSDNAVVTMTNCTNNGDIVGERTGDGGSTIALGGIIGTCWYKCETRLTNVTNNGKISAVNNAAKHNAHVGGIIGMANPNATVIIESATSNGALSCAVNNTAGSPNVGGLVGQVNNATLTIRSATITENVTVSASVAAESTNPLKIDALLGNVTFNSNVSVSSESIINKSEVSCRYTTTGNQRA